MPAFLFKSARSAHTNAIISASVLYEQDHLLFSFHCRGRLGPLSLAARGCPLAFIDGGVFVQVCHQNRKPNPRGRPRLPRTALTSVSSSQRNYFRTDQASRSGDCSSDRIGRGVSPENGDWAARKPSPCLRCAVHLNEARPNVAPFLRGSPCRWRSPRTRADPSCRPRPPAGARGPARSSSCVERSSRGRGAPHAQRLSEGTPRNT